MFDHVYRRARMYAANKATDDEQQHEHISKTIFFYKWATIIKEKKEVFSTRSYKAKWKKIDFIFV